MARLKDPAAGAALSLPPAIPARMSGIPPVLVQNLSPDLASQAAFPDWQPFPPPVKINYAPFEDI
ncbi:MAG TPA: hypothetical protein VLH15_06850 [Dehalococcoidales bacterium]|nr:hypothetical protein [Dehalococcoidales bacterium]